MGQELAWQLCVCQKFLWPPRGETVLWRQSTARWWPLGSGQSEGTQTAMVTKEAIEAGLRSTER